MRIDVEQIRDVILQEVVKRDVVESEKFSIAEKVLARAANKALRAKKPDETNTETFEAPTKLTPETDLPAPPAAPATT